MDRLDLARSIEFIIYISTKIFGSDKEWKNQKSLEYRLVLAVFYQKFKRGIFGLVLTKMKEYNNQKGYIELL